MAQQPAAALFSPQFVEDPHPTYAELRATAPVCPAFLPTGDRVWVVTKYADVVQGLSDARITNAPKERGVRPYANAPAGFETAVTTDMLLSDPPRHTRLRALLTDWLSPKRVQDLRGHIENIRDELLDGFSDGMVIDLVQDFSEPFASRVLAGIAGVPRDFHTRFCAVGHLVVVALLHKHDDDLVRYSDELLGMARHMIEAKRAAPADDVVSALVAAHDEGRISGDELTSMMHLLLIAGHEGPTNLIGNAVHQLLENPDQLERLRADPGLLPGAVEEFMRIEPPLDLSVPRQAEVPITLSDVTIPAGEPIVFSLLSAGRDGERYEDPDRLDVGRGERGHVSFGWGRHYCAGAGLGRLEVQVALEGLLARFPGLCPADGEKIVWRPSLIARGPSRLCVELRAG
jgi:cytochrome P450